MALNINLFFIVIISILILIFTLFKPLHVSSSEAKESSLIDVNSMKIYKITKDGLLSTLSGKNAKQFLDRYELDDLEYIKNSFKNRQYLESDFAQYKESILSLRKNVVYKQDDGLMFKSDEAQFNEKKDILTTQNSFLISKNGSWAEGKKLLYNNKSEHISAKDFSALYKTESNQ